MSLESVLASFSASASALGLSEEGYLIKAIAEGDLAVLNAIKAEAQSQSDPTTEAVIDTAIADAGINELAPVGSIPNAQGAEINSTTLTLQPASGLFPGLVSTSAQTFSGLKTLSDGLDLDGNVISSVSNPVSSQDAATKAYVDSLQSPTGDVGISPANRRYVRTNGSDAAFPSVPYGDGSLLHPYLTIGAAETNIALSTPSGTNRFLIDVGPGTFNEGNTWAPKEHIFYSGAGMELTTVRRTDGSIIEQSVSAGYTSTTVPSPNFAMRDMTIQGGYRLTRPSTGISNIENFTAGYYRVSFATPSPSTIVRAGTVTTGSQTMTLSSTSDLRDGMVVTGTGVPTGGQLTGATTIKVVNATTILMSSPSTASNSTNKTFTIPSFAYYGAGTVNITTNARADQVHMVDCFSSGMVALNASSTGGTNNVNIQGGKFADTFIVTNEGTNPQALATVTASGGGTVTVAPGSGFNPGGFGTALLHISVYPTAFNRLTNYRSGSAVLTNLPTTAGILAGYTVTSAGLTGTIATVDNEHQVTLTSAAGVTQSGDQVLVGYAPPATGNGFAYDSYDDVTGVFSGAVGLFAGILPPAGTKISSYPSSTTRINMVTHSKLVNRSWATDFGSGTVSLDLFGGSWLGGAYIFDGINARTTSDVAGLSVNTPPLFINGAIAELNFNLLSRSFPSNIPYPFTSSSDWPGTDAASTFTANTTSGSATISGFTSTEGIYRNMTVSGPGIPTGARVRTVAATSITINAPSTATATGVTIYFLRTNPKDLQEAVDFLALDKYPVIQGNSTSPKLLTAGTALTFTARNPAVKSYIAGSGGPVVVTANPQIQAGSREGQLLLLVGTDDTNTVTYSTGTGLLLDSATVVLGDDDQLWLSWDQTASLWKQAVPTVGANRTLSNLAAPTAINQDLLPSGSIDLGSSANRWDGGYFGSSRAISLIMSDTQVPSNDFLTITSSSDNQETEFSHAIANSTYKFLSGPISVSTEGFGLKVKEGSNAKQGAATLVAGTVSVANTSVTGNSRIFLTCQDTNGGVPGALYVSARVDSTSFNITSTSALDTSIVAYEIFEPAP